MIGMKDAFKQPKVLEVTKDEFSKKEIASSYYGYGPIKFNLVVDCS